MALSTSGNCMKYTLFGLNFIFVVSQKFPIFLNQQLQPRTDRWFVDNWNYHLIGWSDCARHLPWLRGLSRRAVFHTSNISDRHRLHHLLHRLLWMFWRHERELLHDNHSETTTTEFVNDLDRHLISVLRSFEHHFHSRTLRWHHRVHLEKLNLLADYVCAQADDAKLSQPEYVANCNR